MFVCLFVIGFFRLIDTSIDNTTKYPPRVAIFPYFGVTQYPCTCFAFVKGDTQGRMTKKQKHKNKKTTPSKLFVYPPIERMSHHFTISRASIILFVVIHSFYARCVASTSNINSKCGTWLVNCFVVTIL